jgi:drug/metabolite transporter (DMT)-like permease
MTIDVDGSVPPTFLRRFMLALTVLTGLVAGIAVAAIVLTALFGGEGESPGALALIGVGAVAIMLHAAALAHVLLRRRPRWLLSSGVFLGGIGLLAVSGAAIVGAELDDSPGGVLAGLLLAAQGGAAVLTVAFPQLIPPRPSRV